MTSFTLNDKIVVIKVYVFFKKYAELYSNSIVISIDSSL